MTRAPVVVWVAALVAACQPQPQAQPRAAPSAPQAAGRIVDGDFRLEGALTQGGLARGRVAAPVRALRLDGQAVPLSRDGQFLLGFGRDAPSTMLLEAELADGTRQQQRLRILPRSWRIDHLPSLKQSAEADPDYDRLRAAELERIAAARDGASDLGHWQERMIWPTQGRLSGVYGSQRVLGGEPRSPHYGIDIAAPMGTPVVAPAGGVVRLAGRYSLEGNLVILDHGLGLASAFLHLSRIDVAVGQRLRQGDPIGAVGSTGRSTGPHLHWGMTLGEVRIDPALLAPPFPGAKP